MRFLESCKQIISKDHTRNLISLIEDNHNISYHDNSHIETNKIKENSK